MKGIKAGIKEVWIDQIKTAVHEANNAVELNPNDDGTCNFDMCLVQKESMFTYQEMIEMFEECGLPARKMNGYNRGYIGIPHYVGQADKNTRWAKTFAESLSGQGFQTSMYYQVD